MFEYHVVVNGNSVAWFDTKYEANRSAIEYAMKNPGSNVVVECLEFTLEPEDSDEDDILTEQNLNYYNDVMGDAARRWYS
jgi:hypothetical protein